MGLTRKRGRGYARRMRVTIIGGGVIGLASAYQMARDGAAVTLVDARATGRGASDVNAGWVCPAEAAPVPAPGMVGQALRWMLRSDSPLYIRPSLKPSFLSFMSGCGDTATPTTIARVWRRYCG